MRRLFTVVAVCVLTLITLANPAFGAVPSVDHLLAQQINNTPLALTPVAITFNHQPTGADFTSLKALGITGGTALKHLPIVILEGACDEKIIYSRGGLRPHLNNPSEPGVRSSTFG